MKDKYWIKKSIKLTKLAKKLFDGVDSVYFIRNNYHRNPAEEVAYKKDFLDQCRYDTNSKQGIPSLDDQSRFMIKFKSGKHTLIESSE